MSHVIIQQSELFMTQNNAKTISCLRCSEIGASDKGGKGVLRREKSWKKMWGFFVVWEGEGGEED